MKPFKWIKKHPVEAAAIATALVLTGGTAAGWFGPAAAAGSAGAGGASIAGTAAAAELAAPLASGGSLAGWGAAAGESALLGSGAVAGDAFLPGALAGTNGLAGGSSSLLGMGTLPSYGANAISGLLGPSDFTAAMAGDAYLPGALGPTGTGTPSMGSKIGSLLASGQGMQPREAMMLSQMMGSGQQEQRPMGAPVDMGNPMQRQAIMTQEQITKKWLLENDPNTYARIYGAPQPMGA